MQVFVLTKTVLSIMSNFVPNETMLVYGRYPPCWLMAGIHHGLQAN